MTKIIDPDSIEQATDIVFDTTLKTVEVKTTGAVDNDYPGSLSGLTLQALYSFMKEEWKTDAALNKFKFPLKMYTKTDGIFINGWTFKADASRNTIRDAGWTEGTDQYAGIVSLGNFDQTTDLAYYSNTVGYDQTTADFDKSGNLNEAILITGHTGYLKCFLRIASGTGTGKLYSEYNLLSEQSISALEPVLYKLPLSNSTDLKINTADSAFTPTPAHPYDGMKINYLAGELFETATAKTYALGDVVQDGTGRWAFCKTGGTVTTPGGGWASFGGTSQWEIYDGEVQIGAAYYAFNRIITGDSGTAQQIYNWAQYQLRQADDINAGDSPTTDQRSGLTVNGNVAELLLEYVGDTLKTKPGLYISGFDAGSTNSIVFRDITLDGGGVNSVTHLPIVSTEIQYPFVATGYLNFSTNLTDETDSNTIYTMYFDNANGNLFDSANAIIVHDNDGDDITGMITASSIGWTFDYDNNEQGGRTKATPANVTVVAQGIPGATWTSSSYQITRATGQNITITADDERNYTT